VYLPAFPSMKDYFQVSDAVIQWVLTANFFGLCLSSLFYGPLTDAYGRRHILLLGLGIFLWGSIGCVVAESIESLLWWRFVQGLGTSAVFVIPGAVIFDIYNKEDAIQAMGGLNTLITLVMSISPLMGSYLNITFGWQANVWFLAGFSLMAFLLVLFCSKESLMPQDRQLLHLKRIGFDYARLATSGKAMNPLMILNIVFGAYMIYIANLSLVYIDYLHVDEWIFSLYQGSILLTFALVSIFHSRFMSWMGEHRVRKGGLYLLAIGATLLFLITYLWPSATISMSLAMMVFTAGFALLCPVLFADYMSVFPEMKGVASALCSSARLVFMAGAVAFSGVVFNGSMLPVGTLMLLLTAMAIGCLGYSLRSKTTC